MKEVTKIMIKKYALERLKYDFMGYPFENLNQLSFHHLIVPRRHKGLMTIENGAILRQNTAHDYLHTIERYDYEMFLTITSEMIDENIKGYLDMENLKYIDDVLRCFEREYCSYRTKKGHLIIKDEYTKRMIKSRD